MGDTLAARRVAKLVRDYNQHMNSSTQSSSAHAARCKPSSLLSLCCMPAFVCPQHYVRRAWSTDGLLSMPVLLPVFMITLGVFCLLIVGAKA